MEIRFRRLRKMKEKKESCPVHRFDGPDSSPFMLIDVQPLDLVAAGKVTGTDFPHAGFFRPASFVRHIAAGMETAAGRYMGSAGHIPLQYDSFSRFLAGQKGNSR